MRARHFEGEQLKAGERIPCTDPVCRIGTCTCKRCPECNRVMKAVTSSEGDHRGEACWAMGCYCQGFQKTSPPPPDQL